MTTRTPKVIDTAPKTWTGLGCPVCGNEDVDYDDVEVCDGSVFQKADCYACKAHWSEEYTLTHADIHDAEFGPVDDPSATRVPNADSALINASTAIVRYWHNGELGEVPAEDMEALQDILEQYGVEI